MSLLSDIMRAKKIQHISGSQKKIECLMCHFETSSRKNNKNNDGKKYIKIKNILISYLNFLIIKKLIVYF